MNTVIEGGRESTGFPIQTEAVARDPKDSEIESFRKRTKRQQFSLVFLLVSLLIVPPT